MPEKSFDWSHDSIHTVVGQGSNPGVSALLSRKLHGSMVEQLRTEHDASRPVEVITKPKRCTGKIGLIQERLNEQIQVVVDGEVSER